MPEYIKGLPRGARQLTIQEVEDHFKAAKGKVYTNKVFQQIVQPLILELLREGSISAWVCNGDVCYFEGRRQS